MRLERPHNVPFWFFLTLPAPLGLDAMVQTWPRLRLYAFPPIALLLGVLERVGRDRVRLLLVVPYWPGQPWFADLVALLEDCPWEIPVQRDLLSQAGGNKQAVVEAMGVAPEGAQLIASGLSTKVVETILQSKAPSMRKSTLSYAMATVHLMVSQPSV